MSDAQPPPPPFNDGGTPPPPPGFGQGPPPPAYGQTPPAPFGGGPPAFTGQQGGVDKPPRPDVKLGAILAVVGSLISFIGVFLPWVTDVGENQNGTGIFLTSDFDIIDNPGSAVIVFAVVTAGLGIALYFAGRVLAVAILTIVFASIAWLIGIGMIGISSDTADFSGGSLGFGAVLQPIAPLITLAGGIVATSKRRKWPTS